MQISRSSAGWLTRFWARFLILTLVQGPAILVGEGVHSKPTNPAAAAEPSTQPLTGDERALHALDRLTFGPQPGDVERVKAIGVMKWIDLQLHPERIDDGMLDAQLQNYPAMRMPLRDLIEDFPSAAIIRAAAEGKIAPPNDRIERAIYEDQISDYEQRRQKREDEAARQPASPVSSGDRQPAAIHPQMPEPVNPGASPAGMIEGPAGTIENMQAKDNPTADGMASADAANSSVQAHEQKLYADLASTAVVNLPPDQRWNRLASMRPEEFRGFVKNLTNAERLALTDGMTVQQKETALALLNPTVMVTGELLQTRLLTDIYSQRQLQAVMTDFWLNHFNVYLRKGPFAPWYLVDYERNAIAPYAMGKFEDLLVATAKSPGMLFYLDNQESIGPHSMAAIRAQMNPNNKNKNPGLNENYGRELMELHTLGVNGGYTQQDVIEVAKAFTGWTVEDPQKGGGFTFNERRHEPGPKYVLGRTIQENGQQEGLEVLHMLAANPATAHHLSQELAERFVSDTPPPALVDRMAKTYLKTDGDIRQVLRTMFTSPEFWSRDAYRSKVKTPEEFVISAVRATGGEVVRPAPLLNAINELGMPFYGCQTPNGYSWTAAAWVNSGDLLDRINIALALASEKLGTATDLDALMKIDGPAAESVEEKEAKLEEIFLHGQLAPQTRDAVLQQFEQTAGAGMTTLPAPQPAKQPQGRNAGLPKRAALVQMTDLQGPIPAPADKQAALLAGLLLGSPEFQKR